MIIIFLFLQGELLNPEQVLKFADYLYLEGDFNNALNEYRRYLFLSKSNDQEVKEKITDCLIRLQRYDEAIFSLKDYADTTKALYTKARIYFLKSEFPMVRELLKEKNNDYLAKKFIGLSYAGEFNFLKAREFIILPGKIPSHKSLLLGGILSIFPGGGHLYCGRFGDALYSMLVISTGSFISYYYYKNNERTKFYLALGISSIFYAGNIYGGINAVRNYNFYRDNEYRQIIFDHYR
jgi:hypothetical protein|uniref:Tetratricopeptide repeat protein n=1 Tax=candidate division WOR-3 bacterium TaxID=2052148 RepID=A0A7V3RGP2_UNCW3